MGILNDHQKTISGITEVQAIKTIQKIVDELIGAFNLPSDISEQYKKFADDEGLLYNSASYRDHFFHPFHTFLLGYVILSELSKRGDNCNSIIPFDEDFLKKWFVASLWHDITYVAEKGPDWLVAFVKERLDININANQDWGSIVSDSGNIKAIDKLGNCFESNDEERRLNFRAWMNKQLTERHDHGILSALLLQRKAESWKNISDKFIPDCSLAIALHNYHQSFYGDTESQQKNTPALKIGKLEIRKYPLAFLLAYCDTAQEWGRPSRRNPVDYLTYNGVKVEVPSDNIEKKFQICVSYRYKEGFNDDKEKESYI